MRRPRVLASLVAVVALAGLPATPAGTTPRPDRPEPGLYGGRGYSVPEAPPACGARACVHWVASGRDAPAEPGAIPAVATVVEDALARLAALGWRAPVPDGALGGGPQVDVYVKDLGGRASGAAARDDDQEGLAVQHGWLAIDRGYVAERYLASLRAHLVPHELAHLVQYAYDAHFEPWLAEATAEWLAAHAGGGLADLAMLHDSWRERTGQPLAGRRAPDGSVPAKGYASAIFLQWLAQRHGPEVVRAVWRHAAAAAPGTSFAPASLDRALAGRSSFATELARFAAANAEWRTPGSGLRRHGPAPRADVRRAGSLVPGGPPAALRLDHTAFALLDVPVPPAGAGLELRVATPAGTASAVALVGRRGSAEGGGVDTALGLLPDGGPAIAALPAGTYRRVTAVLVNTDVTRGGGGRRDAGGQWTYARDGQRYAARVVLTGAGGPG